MINKIVLHCSALSNSIPHDAVEIHRWHKERKFDGVGYHHVILVDGQVQSGRPHYWPGAHVRGQNTGSLGICITGEGDYSEAQIASLISLLLNLTVTYPEATIYEHQALNSKKTCPLFDVDVRNKLTAVFGKKFIFKLPVK